MNTKKEPAEDTVMARRRRSILNKAQYQELSLAEQLVQVAQRPVYAPVLAEAGLDAEFLGALQAEIDVADALIQSTEALVTGRLRVTQFERETKQRLVRKLRSVQARAKSKYAASDKTALRDYFIGQNVHSSRALLERAAGAILSRAQKDNLPGLTPQVLDAAKQALADFKAVETEQSGTRLQSTLDRKNIDRVIKAIAQNRRRIQFVADAEWPPGRENSPIRRDFRLPVGRAL